MKLGPRKNLNGVKGIKQLKVYSPMSNHMLYRINESNSQCSANVSNQLVKAEETGCGGLKPRNVN